MQTQKQFPNKKNTATRANTDLYQTPKSMFVHLAAANSRQKLVQLNAQGLNGRICLVLHICYMWNKD